MPLPQVAGGSAGGVGRGVGVVGFARDGRAPPPRRGGWHVNGSSQRQQPARTLGTVWPAQTGGGVPQVSGVPSSHGEGRPSGAHDQASAQVQQPSSMARTLCGGQTGGAIAQVRSPPSPQPATPWNARGAAWAGKTSRSPSAVRIRTGAGAAAVAPSSAAAGAPPAAGREGGGLRRASGSGPRGGGSEPGASSSRADADGAGVAAGVAAAARTTTVWTTGRSTSRVTVSI